MFTDLNFEMRDRVWSVLKYQNRNIDPFRGEELLTVKAVYIVGDKIFLGREAAEEWVKQTRGASKIEEIKYSTLYNYYYPRK